MELIKSDPAIIIPIKFLKKILKITDLGDLNFYLGMSVERGHSPIEGKFIFLHQNGYIMRTLEEYAMSNCKPSSSPADPSSKLCKAMGPKDEEERRTMENIPYRGIVGSLIYAMICTRPDIAQAVIAVSQYSSNPGPEHFRACKRILRYLKGKPQGGIMYRSIPILEAYSDSDWGTNPDHGRSITGYVIFMGGGPICWSSKTQKSVALSSCEAEYYALAEVIKELLWVVQFLTELGFPPPPRKNICRQPSCH